MIVKPRDRPAVIYTTGIKQLIMTLEYVNIWLGSKLIVILSVEGTGVAVAKTGTAAVAAIIPTVATTVFTAVSYNFV